MRTRWSRYGTTKITRHQARGILTILAEIFSVRRPRLVFVRTLPYSTLADYTPESGYARIQIKENNRHSIIVQTLCHEFAHHIEHLERGKTNHGDYFHRALSRVYGWLEIIEI